MFIGGFLFHYRSKCQSKNSNIQSRKDATEKNENYLHSTRLNKIPVDYEDCPKKPSKFPIGFYGSQKMGLDKRFYI